MLAEAVTLGETISPAPSQNQWDAAGFRSRNELAQQVWDQHVAGLRSRRQDDLIREKYFLHCIGGDLQWADIYSGQRVEIPAVVSEYHKTENILGLIAENTVAHHTSQRFRFGVDFTPDWRSKEVAIVDTLFANYLSDLQWLNAKTADALYMALSTGFCPLHGYWVESGAYQWTDPDAPGGAIQLPGPGMLDIFVGNPFDTVFDKSATKDSCRWMSYGRIMAADAVRAAFDHVPEARTLEGSGRIPSASEFQRIGRKWRTGTLGLHGNPFMNERSDGDELVTVVVKEIAPGVLAQWPQGRLVVIAVTGFNDPQRDLTGGTPILLADQPLPAGRFSWKNVYSDQRGNDIHGNPWIANKDQLQIDLNIAISEEWRLMMRQTDAPLITPAGAVGEDMADFNGYSMLEVEPSLANWHPRMVEFPQWLSQSYAAKADNLRERIFELGGFHAASRGESLGSRTAYRTVVALQQADSTIHGPVNERLQRSVLSFMGEVCHPNFVTFGAVPWVLDAALGDQYAHLIDPYIDNTRVSQTPPRYKLVNSWGSPEVRTQELMEYLAMKGADGEVVLPTADFRRLLPNPLIFGDKFDAKATQQRRAATVASAIRHQAVLFREQTGIQETGMMHPWVQQAGQMVFQQIEQMYPRMQDDDLQMNLASLSEITQDETCDSIARVAAQHRQALFFAWQMQMAMGGGAPMGGPAPGQNPQQQQMQQGSGAPQERPGGQDPRGVAVERGRGVAQ